MTKERNPVTRRDLDELEEITREYSRLTDREVGAWTGLASGLWIVGAEYLFQASPVWGRLAFLALVPASLAFYLLERRLAQPPHGSVAWTPRTQRERNVLPYARVSVGLAAFLGVFMAVLLLFAFSLGIDLNEVPEAAIPVALIVFPLVVAAPAAAPFLTRWRIEGSAVTAGPLLLNLNTPARWYFPEDQPVAHLGILGLGCLAALVSLMYIWLHRTQLRMLDHRLAHLRSRLR